MCGAVSAFIKYLARSPFCRHPCQPDDRDDGRLSGALLPMRSLPHSCIRVRPGQASICDCVARRANRSLPGLLPDVLRLLSCVVTLGALGRSVLPQQQQRPPPFQVQHVET